jgi:uncharacterized membrane protein
MMSDDSTLTDGRRACFAIGAIAIAAMLIALSPFGVRLRLVVVTPLVLYLPGRAILNALLPAPRQNLESTVMAVGLSLAITIGSGLVLNQIGCMTSAGWALALGAVTLAACIIGAWFRPVLRPRMATTRPFRPQINRVQWAAFAGAALIAAAAVATARLGALGHREYAYTEFWMVPHDADQNVVTLGIKNAEKTPTSYDVGLVADGASIGRWPAIQLQAGESWTDDVDLRAAFQRGHQIQAWLYKSDDPGNVYRKVWLSNLVNAATPLVRDH